MAKRTVTLADIKMSLTLDLAKMHKGEREAVAKAKDMQGIYRTTAYDAAIGSKSAKLIRVFEEQEKKK